MPPPGDRPLVRMPGGHEMPGEDNLRWSELVRLATRFGRLSELGAPAAVLAGEGAMLVAAFEAAVRGEASAQEPPSAEDAPSATTPSHEDGSCMEAADPTVPLQAAIARDGSILVQFAYAALHLAADGRVLDAFPTFGARLGLLSPDLRHALFSGLGGLHVRDLDARRWIDSLPDDLPCVTLDEGHEESYLVDPRRGLYRRLFEVADYPALEAISPDGRFVWVEDKERSGGVYEVERGVRVLVPEALAIGSPPLLERDGRLEEDADHERAPSHARTAALALAGGDRFLLAAHGVVSLDDRVMLRIAEPWPVVAFARAGDALLVVRRDVASWIDLQPLVVRRRFQLSDLHAALRLDGVAEGSDEERHALLLRYGGAWGLSRARAKKAPAPPKRVRVV
jgi:hypothetical protein